MEIRGQFKLDTGDHFELDEGGQVGLDFPSDAPVLYSREWMEGSEAGYASQSRQPDKGKAKNGNINQQLRGGENLVLTQITQKVKQILTNK